MINYPTLEASIEEKRTWARDRGLSTTIHGLILPSSDREHLDKKICKNIKEVAARIENATSEGRYVIYLPGSYDLVHIGHLSYVEQCVDRALRNLPYKTFERDLFLVALAESDSLIRQTKAGKHVAGGGEETFFRPVEYGYKNGRHPRLDSLASLPVHCVSFLPSPNDTELLPTPRDLDKEKAIKLLGFLDIDPDSKKKIANLVKNYPLLAEKLKKKETLELGKWLDINLWQLYLHRTLSKQQGTTVPHAFDQKTITRIVSQNDSSYSGLAAGITNICNIGVSTIQHIQSMSTTKVLKQNTPKELLNEKNSE